MSSTHDKTHVDKAGYLSRRPLASISRLIQATKPLAEKMVCSESNSLVNIPVNEVWLIEDGLMVMYRDEGKHLFFICSAPLILGVNGIFNIPVKGYVIGFMRSTVIHKLSTEQFVTQIGQQNLWEDLARLTGFYFANSLENNARLVKKDNYNVIKSLILEYQYLPEFAREKTSLSSYVIQKGMISRSYVLKVLSTLNKCGYIKVNRGKLLYVDYLPAAL
jgi:hypothetical protein